MISKILEMIGNWMIQTRKEKNITQANLAELCGLHEGVIRRYEREGYLTCSLHRMILIARQLEMYNPRKG